jgi:hypothetical protein
MVGLGGRVGVMATAALRIATQTVRETADRRLSTVSACPAATGEVPRTLVWVDRHGQEVPVAAPPRRYSTLQLSPDGTSVALEIRPPESRRVV